MEQESLLQKIGLAKIVQLMYLAKNSSNSDEVLTSLNLALYETKNCTKNTSLYKQIISISKDMGHTLAVDEEWCDKVNKSARHQYELIQEELQRDKNNGIKEKIRLSYIDMGNLFFDIGEYSESQKNYMRAKDYCSIPEHTIEICRLLVKVNWMLSNYGFVESFCMKGVNEQKQSDEFQAMLGLCCMLKGRYEQAVESFSKVSFTGGQIMISCALSCNDIARYGVLCAISSLNRPQLVQLNKNDNFREFLELEPQYRDLLNMVTRLRYKEAMVRFKTIIEELKLDCYCGPLLDKFLQKLKVLAVTGVFNAFEELSLETISGLIGEPQEHVLAHIEPMITSDQLAARIDGRTNTIRKVCKTESLDVHQILAMAQLVQLRAKYSK